MSRESDVFVLQTRFFVTMRRVLVRVIDLEYMRENPAYAHSVLRAAEGAPDEELRDLAARLRQLMGLTPPSDPAPGDAPAPTSAATPTSKSVPSLERYIGGIR